VTVRRVFAADQSRPLAIFLAITAATVLCSAT